MSTADSTVTIPDAPATGDNPTPLEKKISIFEKLASWGLQMFFVLRSALKR